MVDIRYILNGKKSDDCNFLRTTPEQRNELHDIIKECKDFDRDIEVNIVKNYLIKEEMCRDRRIRKKVLHKIIIYGGGKVLLPNELKNKYKNKKICYCCYDKDFNETIITVIHELYHFNDFFNFFEYHKEIDNLGNNISLRENLRYNIKEELSEFFVGYKIAKKFSNQSRFRDILIMRAKLLFNFLIKEIEYSKERNKRFENFNPSVELMNEIFEHKFNRLFRIMGIWRGFKKFDSFLVLQEIWDDLLPIIRKDDYLIPDLFGYLREQLLNEKIESLENNMLRKFEDYFITHLHFNFN